MLGVTFEAMNEDDTVRPLVSARCGSDKNLADSLVAERPVASLDPNLSESETMNCAHFASHGLNTMATIL
jgi:hypothetical protein